MYVVGRPAAKGVLAEAYAHELRDKKLRFRTHTGTRKAVMLALFTTYPTQLGRHAPGIVDAVVEAGEVGGSGVSRGRLLAAAATPRSLRGTYEPSTRITRTASPWLITTLV